MTQRQFKGAYLYADGRALTLWERMTPTETDSWCEVYPRFVHPEVCRFTGRLRFTERGESLFWLLQGAARIEVSPGAELAVDGLRATFRTAPPWDLEADGTLQYPPGYPPRKVHKT